MATRIPRSPRRTQALSRERIIEAAVEVLDTAGEDGLTFRVLTERLATGPGAIYWHVANKGELLSAATDTLVAAALAGASAESAEPPGRPPRDEIRAVALGLHDAVAEHPWLATQLARSAWGSVTPRILEAVGRQIRALGVPEGGWFTAASVLVHYILGAAGQNAANAAQVRTLGPGVSRAEVLGAVAEAWERLDPDDYPFTRALAGQAVEHDDREQFLAGIDLLLAGISGMPGTSGTAVR